MNKTEYVHEKAAIGICIDKLEKDVFMGTVHTPYHKENDTFQDVVELLFLLERIAEERGFPNAMYKNRSLKKKIALKNDPKEGKLWRTEAQMRESYEKPVTFMIYITSRKYGTLQGHILYHGVGNIIKYQSELELIGLIEKHYNCSGTEQIQNITKMR